MKCVPIMEFTARRKVVLYFHLDMLISNNLGCSINALIKQNLHSALGCYTKSQVDK